MVVSNRLFHQVSAPTQAIFCRTGFGQAKSDDESTDQSSVRMFHASPGNLAIVKLIQVTWVQNVKRPNPKYLLKFE